MSRSWDDQEVQNPLPVREFSRVTRAGPGRLVTLPVIVFGFLMAAWLFFDAALDQRRTPHTTIVTLASVATLIAVIATLLSLLSLRSTTFLWIAAAGFASAAALSLAGHLTFLSGLDSASLRSVVRQLGGLIAVAGPPILAGLVLALLCGWLARRTHWAPPW